MALSLLKWESSIDHTVAGQDAKSYLLRNVVKYQSITPSLHGLSIPTDQAAEQQRRGLLATSENLNLLERQAQGSKDVSVMESTLPLLWLGRKSHDTQGFSITHSSYKYLCI